MTRSSQPTTSFCKRTREKTFMLNRRVDIAVKGHIAAVAWRAIRIRASWSAIVAVCERERCQMSESDLEGKINAEPNDKEATGEI